MKHLIVCCDGTWQSEDTGEPSNVWKLCNLLADRDAHGAAQRIYYQPGVGTDVSRSRLARRLSRLLGGGLGWGLDDNIKQAYRWLIREYEPGDSYWLFGFSRGAYTARSLAGLLRNCGLLEPRHEDQIDQAMRLYRARDPASHPRAPQSRSFRRNYSRELEAIAFLGVWDTVGALGIPSSLGPVARLVNRRHQFHDVALSSRVRRACHALAIDEQRRAFQPSLWGEAAQRRGVEQVWFAGVHSDVGGGYAEAGLSDITLAWMIDRAGATGLAFDTDRVAGELGPDALARLHDSRWLIHRVPGLSRPRRIKPGHRQFVHPSAVQRLEQADSYEAANLAAALEAGVPVLATGVEASPVGSASPAPHS